MTKLRLPYGRQTVSAAIPAAYSVEYVWPPEQAPSAAPDAIVRQAVYNPLGDVRAAPRRPDRRHRHQRQDSPRPARKFAAPGAGRYAPRRRPR